MRYATTLCVVVAGSMLPFALACSTESAEPTGNMDADPAPSATPSASAPTPPGPTQPSPNGGSGGAPEPPDMPGGSAGAPAGGSGGQGVVEEQDSDADGVFTPGDCNDTDPLAHPGALERCNTADDDCDGVPDNDCLMAPVVDRAEHAGHEYAAYRGSKLPHAEAERGCQLLGMDLVRIDNAEENAWLVDFAFNQGMRDESCATPCTWHCEAGNTCDQAQIWIGGNDKAEENTWTWRIGGDVFFTGLGKAGVTTQGMFTSWGQAGGGPDELQPNNEQNNETVDTWEDCLVLRTNAKWFDLGCQNRRAWYVCEQGQ